MNRQENDHISRQAAIRWVKTECNPYGKPTLDFESGEKVIEHLKRMSSAQQRWIPVTERLPEEPYGCLVTVLDDDYYGEPFPTLLPYFVGWDGKQWNDGDGMQCPFEVTAWLPLPEPYKEEEDE